MSEPAELVIIAPPVADETDALGFGLVSLTEAISQRRPDSVSHGLLGGEFGYGANWECGVFLMRPYCWCEHVDCLWCTPWLSHETECSEDEAKAHRAKQDAEIAARFGADSYKGWSRAPNFWHKASGLKVNWYKWIGRDMEVFNPNAADINEVMRECVAAVYAARETVSA
jgi:hypothetical protein